jgi:tetratricopeptide (TPR) repeat protein
MEDSAFGALGDVLRAQGKHAEAVLIFEKLVQENPKNDYYRIELGHSQWRLADALRALGQRKQAEMVRREALQIFEKAAQDFPGNPYLRQEQAFSLRELGDLVSELGRVDEAELQYRTAIKLYTALIVDAPTNSYYQAEEAYTTWMLAGMLDRAGRSEAAAIEYRQAIIFHEKAMARFPADKNLKPRLDSIRASLDSLLVSLGKPPEEEAFHRERVAEQRETIERIRKAAKSGDVSALNEVAWRLATCSFAELRDGPSAVSFAEKAVASTNRKEPNALDTLAAAYAESGQFAKAVSVQNEAINLLRDEKIKSDFATRLRLYELNSPYRTRN